MSTVICHLVTAVRALFLTETAICSIDPNPQDRSRRRHVCSMPKLSLDYANRCHIIDAPTPPHTLLLPHFWAHLCSILLSEALADCTTSIGTGKDTVFDRWTLHPFEGIQRERLNLLHLIRHLYILFHKSCNFTLNRYQLLSTF